jgi:hypothetical protein
MTIVQLTRLVEAVGIPAATAAAMGFLLWKLIQYILRDLRSDMANQNEATERALHSLQSIVIQQVDRTRTMERNVYRFQDAIAVKIGIARVDYDQTRKERYDEAKQVLRDVGKINGDD